MSDMVSIMFPIASKRYHQHKHCQNESSLIVFIQYVSNIAEFKNILCFLKENSNNNDDGCSLHVSEDALCLIKS